MGRTEVSALADACPSPQQGGDGLPQMQNPDQPLGQGFPIAHFWHQHWVIPVWGHPWHPGVLSRFHPLDARSMPSCDNHRCPQTQSSIP